MNDLFHDYFSGNPGLELWALGSRIHKGAIDRRPYGVPCRFVASEDHPDIVKAYLSLNRRAFSGELALPGWVLTDLYLVPGVVGLLVAPLGDLQLRFDTPDLGDGRGIVAAYYASPSLRPGMFVGVSLISAVPGLRAGPRIKVLTLRMYRANSVRGVSSWDSKPIRAHSRLGPMQIVGSTPGPHERAARSFVYQTSLIDEEVLKAALTGSLDVPVLERPSVTDLDALGSLLARAEAGERLVIAPPGVDSEGQVCIASPH